MITFIPKKVYKEKDPYTTIHQIRNILYDCGIFLRESSVYHSISKTAAAELRLGDVDMFGLRIATNGKGMNPRYAMASAYGEFMERLQTGILFQGYRLEAYRRGDIRFRYFPDEKDLRFSELDEDYSNAVKTMFRLSDEQYREMFAPFDTAVFKCVPFTDAFSGKQVYFPVDEIMCLVASNGMCAGNTRNEALAQGISELFERDTLMRIYRDNNALKLLRKEWFADTAVLRKLSDMESLGYEVRIIDGSMGMNYPVIGLFLRNKDGILMNLGADPNPVVALERCLTEIFQMLTQDSTKLRVTKDSCGTRAGCTNLFFREYYDLQFQRSRTLGSGEKPDNVFHLGEHYSEDYSYNSRFEDDYVYLRNLIQKLGYHLYIRDCSYLGFPAFITLIPEISLADYRLEALSKAFAKVLETGIPMKELDESSYQYILPVLRKLEEKMGESLA